jgi:hypothetical protein
MAKKGSTGGGGFGGIGGILGFFGTTIKCDSTDESIFCNIMKMFNLLIVFVIIVYMIWIAYNLVYPWWQKRLRRR